MCLRKHFASKNQTILAYFAVFAMTTTFLLLNSRLAARGVRDESGGDENFLVVGDGKPARKSEHFVAISAACPRNPVKPDGNPDFRIRPEWTHVFYAPIVARGWLALNVSVLALLVGSREQCWERHPAATASLRDLADLSSGTRGGAPAARLIVHFLSSDEDEGHEVVLSQVSRLFAAQILKNYLVSEGTEAGDEDFSRIWLTTADADLFPVDGTGVLRIGAEPGWKLRIVEPFGCCGFFSNGWFDFFNWMHPISYLTMSVDTWGEVMRHDRAGGELTPPGSVGKMAAVGRGRVGRQQVVTPRLILETLAAEFGREAAYSRVKHWEGDEWYMDQHLISLRIKAWTRREPTGSSSSFPFLQGWSSSSSSSSAVKIVQRNVAEDRVDRLNWAWPQPGRQLGQITDAHLPLRGFCRREWTPTSRLMESVFEGREDILKHFGQYRNSFVRLLRSSVVHAGQQHAEIHGNEDNGTRGNTDLVVEDKSFEDHECLLL